MKTNVTIEWDKPKEKHWLCPDNIQIALSAYCKNTKFKVTTLEITDEHKTAIFEALGEASMSWSPRPKGQFDATNCKRIGEELIEKLSL